MDCSIPRPETHPKTAARAEASANGTAAPPPPLTFARTKHDAIRLALLNVLEVLEHDPVWEKSVGFDELLNDVVFVKRPPYLRDTGPWRPRPVTEQDDRETAIYLQETYGFWVGSSLAGEGLTTYACRFPFHPIRDYLAGLVWDKEPRLDTWLTTYCHVGLTPFTSAVASKTLIAAVARVYDPGCKVDTMTILEGPQGTLKTTVWNTLASDAWFADWLPDLHDKDAAQTLCGKWFVEFGELSNFQRSEVETVKRFVSAKQDHYRPAYGKKALTVPRQNIFVGSTNEEHYFKDSTGNRRFWPVAMDGEADIAGLTRDRDQLWAEAVDRYRQGEIWYLTGPLAQAAAQAQAQRVELDDWEDEVLTYLADHQTTSPDGAFLYVTTRTILCEAFHLDNPLHWTQSNTKRLGGILRRNGWSSRPVWNTDKTKQFKAFTKAVPQQKTTPGTSVTGNGNEKMPTGNSESRSNDAPVTHVTGVTGCFYKSESDATPGPSLSPSLGPSSKRPVTGVTPVTTAPMLTMRLLPVSAVLPVTAVIPVTDSERPPGVSPVSSANGLGVSHATFPPGRPFPDEAGEVLSREGLSERSERPLTGSPTRISSPSPGGNGAAGASALACAVSPCPESETGQHTWRTGRCIWCATLEGA